MLSTIQLASKVDILVLIHELAIEANMDIPLEAANPYGADMHAVLINCAIKNSACDQNANFWLLMKQMSIGVELCSEHGPNICMKCP